MSTKHAIAAARFLENKENEAWHDHTLWMVRTKRDKMSHSLPEWERLRELASEIKLYSNSHLDTLLEEFEKNAIANGAIVHWAKDAGSITRPPVPFRASCSGIRNSRISSPSWAWMN